MTEAKGKGRSRCRGRKRRREAMSELDYLKPNLQSRKSNVYATEHLGTI